MRSQRPPRGSGADVSPDRSMLSRSTWVRPRIWRASLAASTAVAVAQAGFDLPALRFDAATGPPRVNHTALVGAHADGVVVLRYDIDLEAELATVDHLGQS